MDRNRAKDIVVSGDQTEGSEAGQLDGPVPRGGMTRGPVRQIVEALGVDPLPRLWWKMGWNGAARKDGTLEWEVGKHPERTFPTSHSCVCDGRGAA